VPPCDTWQEQSTMKRVFSALIGLGVAAASLTAMAPAALAQYPDKPVHVLVGFPPGGGADILVRWFAAKLQQKSGGTFVVENRVGASGNISLGATAKAKPDGYTMLFASTTTTAGNNAMFKQMPLDVTKDIEPLMSFGETPFVLTVAPNSPINNVKELTAYLKSKGGKATQGWATTIARAATVLYTQAAGVPVTSVGYKSTAMAVSDVTAGQIDFAFADIVFATGQAKQKRIKILAVTSDSRAPGLPDVPTMKEAAGVPLGDITPLWGIWVPAGTPKEVKDKLTKWMTEICQTKEAEDFLLAQGATPKLLQQAAYKENFAVASKAWQRAAEQGNMRQ
jgi:tripartite-type tricarboxylate transporter receptor subunit TctC